MCYDANNSKLTEWADIGVHIGFKLQTVKSSAPFNCDDCEFANRLYGQDVTTQFVL